MNLIITLIRHLYEYHNRPQSMLYLIPNVSLNMVESFYYFSAIRETNSSGFS
jgi:hypothetical protein